jgi:hypothetical protein
MQSYIFAEAPFINMQGSELTDSIKELYIFIFTFYYIKKS